jgi:NAD(P)H dehydrogenase (quinone)
MGKKLLVTRSTGATGSKTVKFLIDAGAGVRAFVHREDERSAALAAQGAEIVRGDLLDFRGRSRGPRPNAGRVLCVPNHARYPAGHGVLRSGR